MKRSSWVFIGHDLDSDNLGLLRAGRISAVLHHDLRSDMRSACQHLMRAHRVLKRAVPSGVSQVQVITPFNLPGHALSQYHEFYTRPCLTSLRALARKRERGPSVNQSGGRRCEATAKQPRLRRACRPPGLPRFANKKQTVTTLILLEKLCTEKEKRPPPILGQKIRSELAAYQKGVSSNGTGRGPVRNSE